MNLPITASSDDINQRFRSLALVLHPDKQRTEDSRQSAQKAFARLARAHQVLIDPRTRAIYDSLGEEGLKDSSGLEVGRRAKSPEQVCTYDIIHDTFR